MKTNKAAKRCRNIYLSSSRPLLPPPLVSGELNCTQKILYSAARFFRTTILKLFSRSTLLVLHIFLHFRSLPAFLNVECNAILSFGDNFV